MTGRKHLLAGLIAVGLLQTAVLGYLVADRVRLLAGGREIVLPIVPVDPRDLFRGEYVRLSYDISRLDAGLLEGPVPAPDAIVYVTLERRSDDTWAAVQMSARRPSEGGADRVVLAARAPYGTQALEQRSGTVWLRYGIESYFVPEGQGPELEKLAGEKRMAAVVAVDRGGEAAIKALVVDGARVYSEPLF